MISRCITSPIATAAARAAGGPGLLPILAAYEAPRNIASVSWFSSSSTPPSSSVHLLVNAVGKDRLGIVSDISKHVTELGGNVGESQAAKLGSYFSMMMLIQIPEAQKVPLEKQLGELDGMNTTVFEAEGASESTYTPQIACKLRFVRCVLLFMFEAGWGVVGMYKPLIFVSE